MVNWDPTSIVPTQMQMDDALGGSKKVHKELEQIKNHNAERK